MSPTDPAGAATNSTCSPTLWRVETPVRAPQANAIAERLVGTVRREILDRILTINQGHAAAVIRTHVRQPAQPLSGLQRRSGRQVRGCASSSATTAARHDMVSMLALRCRRPPDVRNGLQTQRPDP